MAQITIGTVTVVLPEGMNLDPRSGKLSSDEKKSLPRARRGVGLACDHTAAAMEKSGGALVVPNVWTPLRSARPVSSPRTLIK